MQKYSQRACEHELSYSQLLTDNNKELHMSEIEKAKKEIKGKRCSLDQNFAIVKEMVDSMVGDDKHDIKKEEVVNKEFCVVKAFESVKEKRHILILIAYVKFINIIMHFIINVITIL